MFLSKLSGKFQTSEKSNLKTYMMIRNDFGEKIFDQNFFLSCRDFTFTAKFLSKIGYIID